jgi:hypothetical protein
MLTMVRLQSEEQVGLMPDDLIVIDRLRASLFEAGNAAPSQLQMAACRSDVDGLF